MPWYQRGCPNLLSGKPANESKPYTIRLPVDGTEVKESSSSFHRDQASHLSNRRLTEGVSFVRLKRSPVLRIASACVG